MDSYYSSMNKVFEYIDNNLIEDLSLRVLSQVSGYSEYHFHRIFHAITGKTLHEYVLCRRVLTAASRLLYEHTSITKIAFDCGFSSSSSFVRCFKRLMGCSPSFYRNNKERKRPLKPIDNKFKEYSKNKNLDSRFSITTLPDMHVAGIISKGLSKDFESRNIEKSFKNLFAWLSKSGFVKENMQVMGITLDSPEVVSFSECRYFACVQADESFRSEDEISVRTFHLKGKFIKFSLERTRADFAKVFFKITDYLYGKYMPSVACYPDNRPFVEFYTQINSAIMINYYIPIR